MNQSSPLSVVTSSINTNINEARDQWIAFEQLAHPSYFQTWAWLGSWCEHSGKHFDPDLYTVFQNDAPIAIAIFTTNKTRRHYFISSTQYHLNESGGKEYDFIIEHNGILTKDADEREVAKTIMKNVLKTRPEIDEIVFSGVSENNYNNYIQAGAKLGLNKLSCRKSKFSYVDLDKVRKKNTDFLSILSSNTRSRIRRSIKAYEAKFGEVYINEASNHEEALIYLQQLKKLHQEHWESRGKPGSFENTRWESFIKDMIKSQFDKHKIQLLKVSAGDTDIGYILNLVNNGYVNMLQSGFKYHTDNKMKPGYVSHLLAIEYNLKNGNHIYDFLAGESQYKDSLSTEYGHLYWFTLQKQKPKFILENIAIRIVRILRGIRLKYFPQHQYP